MTVSTASIPVLHSAEVAHLYPQVVSYASCSSHFLREMTSKLTTRPLQRISLVRNNREGWIGDYGAGLVGVKNTTDEATQYEGHRSLPPLPRR